MWGAVDSARASFASLDELCMTYHSAKVLELSCDPLSAPGTARLHGDSRIFYNACFPPHLRCGMGGEKGGEEEDRKKDDEREAMKKFAEEK